MNPKKIIIIISASVIGILLLSVLLHFFLNQETAVPAAVVEEEVVASTTPEVQIRPPFKEAPAVPSGSELFRNEFYRFQFLYPDSLVLKEYPEPVSAVTLSFRSADNTKKFQIFIIPHGDPYITPFRLAQDLPSGIQEQKNDINFLSAKGSAFVSERADMGETKEIWFIERGFLYEISVPLADEAWLSEILRTWEFL